MPQGLREIVSLLGVALAALALLDPSRTGFRLSGLACCLFVLVIEASTAPGARRASARILAGLCVVYSLASTLEFLYGADSIAYYAYLHSFAFDRNLDFANEWAAWGFAPTALTATGLHQNAQSVGPAMVWSPFYLLAHLYVLVDQALGSARHAADGFSDPYRRATVLGTLTAVYCGALGLTRALQAWVEPGAAALAAVGAVLASPVLYYTIVSPAMAHGVEFGVAALFVFALLRAREAPTPAATILVGALFGLLVAVRWQAAAYLLLVAPLALGAWRRRAVRAATLAGAVAAGALMVAPQLLAWRALYGSFFTMPQGGGFVDWSSPHFFDVLLSANHGLFSWTPAMLLGAVGLVLGLRRDFAFHAGALAVCGATTWVNGGVRDYWGGDAFGARRFCLIVPLLAVGLGHAVALASRHARQRPLVFPAALMAGAVLWNAGFISAFLGERFPEAAPLERVSAGEARGLRQSVEALMGALAGASGRALAYRVLSGQYLFGSFNPSGVLTLADLPEQELLGRWSPRRRPPEGPAFRWALGPRSCVRLPLEGPFPMRVFVRVRAPQLQPQAMDVSINGQAVASRAVNAEWSDADAEIPERFLVPGENWLCLRFSNAGSDADGPRAQVAQIRVRNAR